jgi:DNA-binding NarL/FixJ family response regulator
MKNEKFEKTQTKKTVAIYGELNFQSNTSYDHTLVENLGGQDYSSFVNQQIDKPKHLITAGSIDITNRERQVIILVADGFSNKEIAEKLHLSIYTVKSHVHNILVKLSLNTRLQIAKHVYQNEYYKYAM